MTVDLRPKSTGETLQELATRLYRVEQESSRPSGAPGTGSGGVGTDPEFNTITIDGIVVGADASPVTGLTLGTGSFMDDIWIDADWTAPSDGTASSYDVELARKVGSSYELVQVFHTGGTGLRMSALWPQTTYGVRVTAINRIDARSDPTPGIGFMDITTGIDATIPAQVAGVSVVAGIRTVTVTWSEVADRDVKRGEGQYEIQLSQDSTFATGVLTQFTSGTIVTFGDLPSGVTQYARVRAIDTSGNAGAWSLSGSDTTGRVETVDLADTAVTTGKLANLAVDNNKLAALAVDAAKLADSAVTPTKIANLAVGSAAIAALAVGTAHIQDASIVTAKIGNLAVTSAQIADLAVTTAKIENLAVDNGKIANLDAGKINAGTISADRIAANSLDVNKLTSSTLTSKTITIGAGGVLKVGNAPTTGILINDQGIRLYSGGAVKVALDVAGTASFEGNISASTITSSTLTSATINSGTIQGVTITGATVRTASSGQRVAFESGVIDRIKMYTGDAAEANPGHINVGVSSVALEAGVESPRATSQEYGFIRVAGAKTASDYAYVQLRLTTSAGASAGSILLRGKTSSADPVVSITGVRELHINFGLAGTNAEAHIKGSGDYCFLRLFGGGYAATLNTVFGLGIGFHVLDGSNGSFHPIQASAFNVSSSQATKRNVRDVEGTLDTLMKMSVKRYQRVYEDRVKDAPPHVTRAYDIEEMGLMAEDLLAISPNAVAMGANGPTGINLGYLVSMLIKAVQEINNRIPGRA